jgi:flagellar hook assembly protein FlgD
VKPNPFSAEATVSFELSARGPVSVQIYDVGGRLVRTLVDGVHDPGAYTVTWDGRSNAGTRVALGAYFFKIRSGRFTEIREAVLVR